ncbi:uncharacterized protein LOC121377268 [Gigantopelta aegis]|uniref:uncharacterized protein LOC121377268 n=1 Tax=Gigantopelta aegis TaxID=1735272 RepID=UPI001B889E04|nr:uncharacterized protein LOC121377268 [Gigantopelta aegis]
MSGDKPVKRAGKRPGRKPSKIDFKAKLERSRQSARECRARKKLRYQYLEELVAHREKAIYSLREELNSYKNWCIQADNGIVSKELLKNIVGRHDNIAEASTSYAPRYVAPLSAREGHSNPSVTRASSFPEQITVGGAFTRAASFPESESIVYSRPQQSTVHPHDIFPGRTAQVLDSSNYVTSSIYSLAGSYSEPNRTTPTNQIRELRGTDRLTGAVQFVPKTTTSFPVTSSESQSVPVKSSFDVPSDNTAFQDAFDILSKLEAANSSRFVSTCTSDIPFTYSHSHSPSQSSFSEQQPSTSTGVKGHDMQPSWYSILTELEPHHSRQGAESTSGTPTMGTPKLAEDDVSLPTVLCDLVDSSTDSSDG